MDIKYIPLSESHFPLLLKWLETPHVKAWWDQDITWTPELIQKKYGDYVKGEKQENGVAKTINGYIISIDELPVGYIQIYNAHDFFRSKPLKGLPKKLGAFDVFIGDEKYIRRGIGTKVIAEFLDKYDDSYTHIFADPDSHNLAAIHAYEKGGFKKIEEYPDTGEIWMIRKSGVLPKYIQQLEFSLLEQSVRQSVDQLNALIADDFIEFGSSGKVYNKQDLLEILPTEDIRYFTVSDFEVKELSKDVMLATYKTTENSIFSLRSSVWKHYDDGWRMVFHQGTKMSKSSL